nr:hypothetical protein [Tanacetum cinerariifolium]
MARLRFCDYHNMVSILEKSEHNVDFHQIVDFVEASPLRRARIAQSSALPPIADEPASPLRDVSQAPRVTSSVADKGTQELEINMLKARVKLLEDIEGGGAKRSRDDAPIKGRNLDEGETSAERVSDNTEEMETVLTSMDASTILESRVAKVSTGSRSIPTAGPPAAEVPTGSDVVPTAGPIFTTATVVTPYTRGKGKETMVESETLKKKKIMIDGLDMSNETVAKYLQEYHQFASELPLEKRIELISDLARYQDNYAKVHKYQSQQRKPWSRKQKRDYYMAFIKSNLGWKEEAERFKRKGIRFEQESAKKLRTSEEVPEKVKSPDEVPEEKVKEMMQRVLIEEVYVEALQVKHHIINWKVHTKGQRSYWKVIRLGGSSASYQFFVDMLKHLDREDLNQLWVLVKESLSIRPPTSDKEMELWVELKRLYKPDDEYQLWTHTQNLMHASVEWKLYYICRVHQVTSKDKEIFMLVEKDYPLRKGLAIGMISYKLQVETYSKMANDLIIKIYKIASSPR